jgi:putative holliday junction resolvase
MRVIGLDLGDKWIGIARSDESARIAYPLEVVAGVESAFARLESLISEEGVVRIVLGLPRNMDGSLGPKAREALRFAEALRARFPVPVETWDERLSTVEAERYLRDAEVPRRRWKERVNQVAAQIVLQSYLDRKNRDESADEIPEEGPEGSEEEEP